MRDSQHVGLWNRGPWPHSLWLGALYWLLFLDGVAPSLLPAQFEAHGFSPSEVVHASDAKRKAPERAVSYFYFREFYKEFFLVEAGKTYFSKTSASGVGFSSTKNLPPQNSSTPGPVSYHYFGSAAFEITSRAFVLSSLSLFFTIALMRFAIFVRLLSLSNLRRSRGHEAGLFKARSPPCVSSL